MGAQKTGSSKLPQVQKSLLESGPAEEVGEIPYGYCHCGCGEKTNLAKKTENKRGNVKGKPYKYVYNHGTKVNGINHGCYKNGRRKHDQGYVQILCRNHPKANNGYVFEHILICEKVLGKHLPQGARPHHVNGIKNDNRNNNLVLCQDNTYHQLLHQRKRAYDACGHAKWLKCPYCKNYDDPINLHVNKNDHYHKKCKNEKRMEKLSTATVQG